MLKHNLLILFRGFKREKSTFLINLIGFTAGLVCTLLIYLWIKDELNVDKFNDKDSRLFHVMENQTYSDKILTTTSTPGLLAETLKGEFPEVELSATYTWLNDNTLQTNEKTLVAIGLDVGPDFFKMFSFPLLHGDKQTLLTDKHAMVISEELALKLFASTEEAIGKQITVQQKETFIVSGVFQKVKSSWIQFDYATSFELLRDSQEWLRSWDSNGPATTVLLKEGASPMEFEKKIKFFIKKFHSESQVELFLQRYSDRYLYGKFNNGKQDGGRIEYVNLFSIVAVVIMIIACVNFMNLSTAQASRKAKEVGVKKAVGAERPSLIIQYFTEAILVALFSLLIALLAVGVMLPAFNLITGKELAMSQIGWLTLLQFVGIALVAGLLAGVYPALYLSAFQPSEVLKGSHKGSSGEVLARKGLVVFQFFTTVILISSVLVIYAQIRFAQSKPLGYNKENLIKFPIEGTVAKQLNAFLTELKNIPGVVGAASLGHNLVGRNNNTRSVEWKGKFPEESLLFESFRGGYGTLEVLGMEIASGRSFSDKFHPDTTSVIFNETGIAAMNLEDPIGQRVKVYDKELEIVGVVKDFNFQSLHNKIEPMFMTYNVANTWNIVARLESTNVTETIKKVEEMYKSFNPGFPFDYSFQDEDYASMYRSEQRVAQLAIYFSVFAVLISCLGLYGLASFTAERRYKEMGIRKALGATPTSLLVLLSYDFTKLVMVGVGLGLPVAYWLLSNWIEGFAYHIDLSVWFFVIAGALALAIGWGTVLSKVIYASKANPVDSLRLQN
ncbi:MAG: ABC transporter permease [Flammeovirgaceae bacterium]